MTVFFSWQSDIKENKAYILDCLNKVKEQIPHMEVDAADRNATGADDIAEAILEKIDNSDYFIADITIINPNSGDRKTPNPNVLYELGYAMKVLGKEKVIMVANKTQGKENFPFDIRNRRIVFEELISKNKGNLISKLTDILLRQKTTFRIPKISENFDPYEIRKFWISFILDQLKKRSKSISGMTVSSDDRGDIMAIRVRYSNKVIYSLNINKNSGFSSDSGISFYGISSEISGDSRSSSNAWGEFKWSKERNAVVLSLHDMSLFEMLPTNEIFCTVEDFTDKLWNKICEEVERI